MAFQLLSLSAWCIERYDDNRRIPPWNTGRAKSYSIRTFCPTHVRRTSRWASCFTKSISLDMPLYLRSVALAGLY